LKTITFVGNGNMALSIAQGLKNSYKIEVVGRDMQKLEKFEKELGVAVEKSLMNNFDIDDKTIMLCVKPANVEEVGAMLEGQARVIYSV